MAIRYYLDLSASTTPTANYPNYWGWELESNLIDTTGTYTILGSATFPTGGIAGGNYWLSGNTSSKDLFAPPSEFYLDWSAPFAFSVWVDYVSSTHFVRFRVFTSGSTQSWYYEPRATFRRWVYRDDSNTLGIHDNTSGTFTLGQWNHCVVRYDPANNKQLDYFLNGSFQGSHTFSLEFKSAGSYTNPRLEIDWNNTTIKVDQFALWHGSVLSDSAISALYNSGNGIVLP